MHFLHFTEECLSSYPVCFLVPRINASEIKRAYLDPHNMDPNELLVMDLHVAQGKKKTPAVEMREYITTELVPIFEDFDIQFLVVGDGDYFKILTGSSKAEAHLGYVMDCKFGEPGKIKVVYVPNYAALFHDPVKVSSKIAQGINALKSYRGEEYVAPGHEVIKFAAYPETDQEIEDWLYRLLEMDKPIAIDIEAFSLKHNTAGIGTICFCWDKHEGIAFAVDYVAEEYTEIVNGKEVKFYGRQVRNEFRRKLLRAFFWKLKQKAIYHHIAFDVYVLIYQLYMEDLLDTSGLLTGMNILLRNWDDTKLIAYLATNSCAGNKLGLKDLSQSFAGNYSMGEDIVDIRRIPLPKLLSYNVVDGCSTLHVHEQHYDTMVADDQLDIYEKVFKPSILDIVQMQLTGMPLNMRKVLIVEYLLKRILRKALKGNKATGSVGILGSPIAEEYTYRLKQAWIDKKNATWKVKRGTIDDVPDSVVFNPNSGPQLQELLYDMLDLPVIDLTDTKLPATGAKTLEKLLNHTQDPTTIAFLTELMEYSAVIKVLSSFIPAMKNAALGPDGWHYLFGNFNLGGTVSGRLSSSDPNLQNIPTGATGAKIKKIIGKLIKWCFEAPPGFVFLGLDFASLEDRISALTTKDPEKLKVYTDGYDGHSLRAYAYFGHLMPDIQDTVKSINSIAELYPSLRGESKAPTFLLTYGGTFMGLMNNCGFARDKALGIESKYHALYVVSDKWVAAKLDEASKTGYVTGAFGLRVRTPLLQQVIRGNKATPYEAEAEGRTAGNALGQSWCLLNSRACNEFMGKVRKSQYRLDIRPCAQIHDAQYYLVPDNVEIIAYVNKHLVPAVQWQDHPDIWHPDVKLGGEVSIFYPSWTDEIVIPNGANEDEIPGVVAKALAKREEKKRKAA